MALTADVEPHAPGGGSARRVSRAALASGFSGPVGKPPMAYLASWRPALAADLLVSSADLTVAASARRVGCGTPFSLSTACKRMHGVSPQEHRHGRRSSDVEPTLQGG